MQSQEERGDRYKLNGNLYIGIYCAVMMLNKNNMLLRISILLLLSLVLCSGLIAPAYCQNAPLTIIVNDDMLKPIGNAAIYIDGVAAGNTNDDGSLLLMDFPSGKHNVTASKEGYVNKTFQRDLSSGAVIRFELKEQGQDSSPNAISIIALENSVSQSKIAEALVYIDGNYVGKTNRHEGRFQIELTPGIHNVTLSKQGLLNNTTTIEVVPGNTYTMLMSPGGKKFSIFDIDLFFDALSKEIMYGAMSTVKLSVVAMMVGLAIGLVMGIGRVSPNRIFRGVASVYVEGVRGLPLLLQLLFVNYGLPFMVNDLTGGQFIIDGFTACVIALGVNSGAYVGEIFKAGIEAIHKGQMEAARSLGMTYNQSMRYIILPQAFKIVLPALGNEFIALIKDSSIALIISYPEILWWAKQVGATSYNAFTPLIAAGIVYLCITIPLGKVVQYMEKKYKISSVRKEGAGLLGKKRKAGGRQEDTA